MNEIGGRRKFITALAASAGTAFSSRAQTGNPSRPRLGVVTSAVGSGGPQKSLLHVRQLGFSACQLHVGMAGPELAGPIRDAARSNGIEITALMTLGEGKMVWNLRDGPKTIGIIPRETREARVAALKRASDLAKACGVVAVHTHCGFIPDNPNEPLYAESVAAI